MPVLFWIDVIVYVLSSVVSLALCLVVLGASVKKPANVFFGLFTLISAYWTFSAALLRLALWLGIGNPLLIGSSSALAFLFMSLFLVYFVIGYLNVRNTVTDLVCGVVFLLFSALTVPLMSGFLIREYYFGPSGTLHMNISDSGFVALFAPLALVGWAAVLFLLEWKRMREKYIALSTVILFVGMILGAVLDIEFPVLSFVTFASVAILGFGILSRQLFNPLRDANLELKKEIEEKKKALDALKESERYVRALLSGIPDAIFYMDNETRFLDFRAPDVFHTFVPREQFIGKKAEEVLPLSIATDMSRCTKRAIETGNVQQIEYALETNERNRYYEARIVRLSDTNALGLVRDVTGRKELEEQLLQTQKMEAVNRLAGGIAHDFNNLLSVMLSFADLSLIEYPGAPVKEYLAQIKNSVLEATELTQALLAFSKKQLLVPSIVDLNTVVASMRIMLTHLLGNSIELKTELDPCLLPVRVDSSQMRQVIMNLVLNAKDAIREKGSVVIRTENRLSPDAGTPSPSRTNSEAYVCLIVRDTGIGMDRETLCHLFEPFYTRKRLKPGTGLGLAMVHGIITQSNGVINVKSEPGAGAEFTICIPAVAD